MFDAFSSDTGATRRTRAWSLLRRWIDAGHAQCFFDHVVHPAFAQARVVLGDRRDAWDATTEALDAVMAELTAAIEAGGPMGEALEHVLAGAAVDGEAALCALLRARLVPLTAAVAGHQRVRRCRGLVSEPLSFDAAPRRVRRATTVEDGGPEDVAARHEVVGRVRAALASLSGPVRDAKLLEMAGMSQRRIAEELHVSRRAVRSRLQVADHELQQRLQRLWSEGL